MYDYIFFDLDGTLTDSQDGIFAALHVMLAHFGLSRTNEELKPFLGPSLWDSCPKYLGFTHDQCAEAIEVFREFYNREGIFINRVYDGIIPLLQKLKAAKKHLVLATGKPDEQANVVMTHFKLAPYFDFIGGSTLDTSRSRKADVIAYAMQNCGLTTADAKAGRILMVGDRENDINGAHQNGIPCAAVLYGYGSRPEFEAHHADYICPSVHDLERLLLG